MQCCNDIKIEFLQNSTILESRWAEEVDAAGEGVEKAYLLLSFGLETWNYGNDLWISEEYMRANCREKVEAYWGNLKRNPQSPPQSINPRIDIRRYPPIPQQYTTPRVARKATTRGSSSSQQTTTPRSTRMATRGPIFPRSLSPASKAAKREGKKVVKEDNGYDLRRVSSSSSLDLIDPARESPDMRLEPVASTIRRSSQPQRPVASASSSRSMAFSLLKDQDLDPSILVKDCWHQDVLEVVDMEDNQHDGRDRWVELRWRSQTRSRHRLSRVMKKCPLKLVEFLEI